MQLYDEQMQFEVNQKIKNNVVLALFFGVITLLVCGILLLYREEFTQWAVLTLNIFVTWVYFVYAYHVLMVGNPYLKRVQQQIDYLNNKVGAKKVFEVVKVDYVTLKKLKYVVIDVMAEDRAMSLYWLDAKKYDFEQSKMYIFTIYERYILEVMPVG